MDTAAYLKRINYAGSLDPTTETLRQLQLAHLLSVPFENLSIHSGEPIILDDDALFNKIVVRRRGGFCYELNGLFAALLRALGFDVQMLSASVANAQGDWGPEFDHMTLVVTLQQRWLVDVGFGDSFIEPLALDERGQQVQRTRAYRIEDAGDRLMLLQSDQSDNWKPQYRFNLQPHVYGDYAEMCLYHQTSPQSHFPQRRISSLLTADGRITLSEGRLITTRGNTKEERDLKDGAEVAKVLREQFDIVL
ncbi:MAG TPA: arylamine N-acetyltransferase [Pyrinomonadaceae bacterium]